MFVMAIHGHDADDWNHVAFSVYITYIKRCLTSDKIN